MATAQLSELMQKTAGGRFFANMNRFQLSRLFILYSFKVV